MEQVAGTVEIEERRPCNAAKLLLIVGPGGAGKSTLGAVLAPLLGRALVDLDRAFLHRIGNIDAFIRDKGYRQYKRRNALLAREVVAEADGPTLLVTSSGFLTSDNPALSLDANRELLARNYGLLVLPSRDLERTVRVIVARQLARSFSRGAEREEATIRARFATYASLGDLAVFSCGAPQDIARALARHLTGRRGSIDHAGCSAESETGPRPGEPA